MQSRTFQFEQRGLSQAASCDINLSYWTFGPSDYINILIDYSNEFGTDSQTGSNNLLIACLNEFGNDSQSGYSKQTEITFFSHERLVYGF